MDYNLMICICDKSWVAIDVNNIGECDRISFLGNEMMLVNSTEDISSFCNQILDYYNIDKFIDIDLSIKIVLVSEYTKLIEELYSYFVGVKDVNIIDAKTLLPLCVLKNCKVKAGSAIDLKCLGKEFSVQIDDKLNVSYVEDKAGKELIVEPEQFAFLVNFDCTNLISNEEALTELEATYRKKLEDKDKEISLQKATYEALRKKCAELEQFCIKLQADLDAKRFDKSRKIVAFKESELSSCQTSSNSTTTAMLGSFFGATSILRDISSSGESKKTVCEFLQTDGELVKKGTPLVKIVEYYCIDKERRKTGREVVLKAKEDGRVFYLAKNGDLVKDKDVIAIISDPADIRRDVMNWYKDMK